MKLNIIRNSVKVLALLLGTALVVAACQREELARPDGLAFGDGVVRFAPEIASGEGVAVKSADTYRGAPVSFGELTSEDGTFTMPISCAVSTIDEPATKATLINDPGSATGSVKPLGDFAAKIDNTFWVAAWDATPSRIIPDATAKGFSDNYVAGSDLNGWYQKVMYRTKDVAGNDLTTPYWMTMQPMPELNPGVTATGPADDEYIWKKINTDHAETKTFFAYANLPESGATVANTAATSQTLALTSLPDKDILLGYYSGEGYSGEPEKLTGTASIHFHHPLTAVKFKKGTLSEGVSITGISLGGVYTSGKTTQSAAAPSTFTWTDTDGNETVSLSSVSVDEDGYIGESILLIPETFTSDNARITVSLTTPTGAKTVYYPLKGLTFSAGCINVFTIGYENDYIDVDINQSVVSGVARSLGVRNVGNDNAYIRLAVTACWVDAGGNIIKGYTDFTAGGTATGLNTTDWAKGTDGFYYYKKAMGPGKNTKALFTSFEPSAAPAEGLEFEMMVSVQAVGGSYAEGKNLSDNAKTAWGSGIPVTDAIE